MKLVIAQIIVLFIVISCSTCKYSSKSIPNLKVYPINHATFGLKWDAQKILIDPVGDYKVYKKFESPELILLTDIHGDHIDNDTLMRISSKETTIIAPLAVKKLLKNIPAKKIIVLDNNKSTQVAKLKITAMPMYNLTQERMKFHTKGRGNGYLLEQDSKRVYISGDTEDIPEMRNLKNIDVAFLCMNLPYTMTIEQAVSATLQFAPKEVYPFHYRGKQDDKVIYSDVEKYKELVNTKNPLIQVRLFDWYK